MRRKPEGIFEHCVEVKVPFHDVDALEVAWHGHYVKYAEIARNAMLAELDYDYLEMKASGYAWPVIELQWRYAHPATYGMSLTVLASLREVENRLWVDYEIHDPDGKLLSCGHTVQVAVDMDKGEMCFSTPEIFREKLKTRLDRSS